MRAIAFDVTHLVSRLDTLATSGIDRVDLAYARHLAASRRVLCGLHYGYRRPHWFSPERVEALVAEIGTRVGDTEDLPSAQWPALRSWILADASGGSMMSDMPPPRRPRRWGDRLRKAALRVAMDGHDAVPEGTIYLNVAQHVFEEPRFFRWLDARPDVMTTFLVHDFLPLDMPEFFRDEYEVRFGRRVETILRHARAIIVTSAVVRDRIVAEYTKRGRKAVPIHVEPLASPLGPPQASDLDLEIRDHPYFVAVSTVEPRKNHLLLFHLWRRLAEEMPVPPKLVLVGAPGWDCAPTLAMLTRSKRLARSIRRVDGLPRSSLRPLIANARALLMPSFAEGYGLPVVEALTLGTPVLASDIPVFREVTQGCAEFLSPFDGDGWRRAVASRLGPAGGASAAREATLAFAAPTWPRYFAGIETFLAGL